jgi:positive regulator of sigma E activity
MRHQEKIRIQRRRRRKLFWLFAAAAVLALLLEEAAVLYVLSTLAVCGLLVVLVFSKLAARDAETQTVAIREAAHEMNADFRALASAT